MLGICRSLEWAGVARRITCAEKRRCSEACNKQRPDCSLRQRWQLASHTTGRTELGQATSDGWVVSYQRRIRQLMQHLRAGVFKRLGRIGWGEISKLRDAAFGGREMLGRSAAAFTIQRRSPTSSPQKTKRTHTMELRGLPSSERALEKRCMAKWPMNAWVLVPIHAPNPSAASSGVAVHCVDSVTAPRFRYSHPQPRDLPRFLGGESILVSNSPQLATVASALNGTKIDIRVLSRFWREIASFLRDRGRSPDFPAL